jgi:hypothetical protein
MLLRRYSDRPIHEGCRLRFRQGLGFGLMCVEAENLHPMGNSLTARRVEM